MTLVSLVTNQLPTHGTLNFNDNNPIEDPFAYRK